MERLAAGVRQIFFPDTSQGAIIWMKGRGKVKGVGRVEEGGVGEGVCGEGRWFWYGGGEGSVLVCWRVQRRHHKSGDPVNTHFFP